MVAQSTQTRTGSPAAFAAFSVVKGIAQLTGLSYPLLQGETPGVLLSTSRPAWGCWVKLNWKLCVFRTAGVCYTAEDWGRGHLLLLQGPLCRFLIVPLHMLLLPGSMSTWHTIAVALNCACVSSKGLFWWLFHFPAVLFLPFLTSQGKTWKPSLLRSW